MRELRLQFAQEFRRLHAFWQPEVGFPSHQTPAFQQAGGKLAPRNQHARRDTGERSGFARQFPKSAEHWKGATANLDAVPRREAELHAQAFLDERALPRPERRGGFGRIGFDLAVKRVAAFHRAHLDEPGRVRFREAGHGAERGFSSHFAAKRSFERQPLRRRRLPAFEHQIRPDEAAGLLVDRAVEIAPQGADRHQRGYAERERTGKKQQPAATPPAVAPRHDPDPGAA